MKEIRLLGLALMMSCATGLTMAANPETVENEAAKNTAVHSVLVVGLNDNIKSNYYSRDMLAESTDITEDSLCLIYNKVIENSLATAARKDKSPYNIVASGSEQNAWNAIARNVRLEGEDEKAAADLTTVNNDQLRNLLKQAGASYLLVLDAHYMKYQEKPFKTLFHYVNYSLYDSNKKKLAQGSNYFTSINPQNKKQMMKSSKKSSEKILDLIEKTLD